MTAPQKAFYSCVDTASIRTMPQPLQHLAIGAMAERAGGKIVSYLGEEPYTLVSHEVLLARLKTSSPVHGVVFMRLAQFVRGDRIHIDVMRRLIEQGYELHFARERVSIRTLEEAREACRKLYIWDWTEKRGRMRLPA